jgi:hypothetical protein
MQKWEYKIIARSRGWEKDGNTLLSAADWSAWWENNTSLAPPVNMVQKLAELGSQGWELVSVTARSQRAAMGVHPSSLSIAGFTTSELWVFKRPTASDTPPPIPKI